MYHTTGKQYVTIEEDESTTGIDTVMKGVRKTADSERACTEDACLAGGSNLMGVKFELNKNCISCNRPKFEYVFDSN